MKSKFRFTLLAWMLVTVTACTTGISQPATVVPPAPGPSIRAVFEGITPCSPQTRPLPQIPADTNCEQMIWKIVLHQDPATGTPATYTLESAYGVPQQGTPGLVGGGTPVKMAGSWAIVKGTKMDPDAVLYQLHSEDPPATLSLLRISADILHVLDRDQALMVGNAAWSYTLNRTDNRLPTPVAGPAADSLPATPTRPAIPPAPAGASVLGVFEGRLPCHEVALELAKIAPYAGCMKIKSRLTLYQDKDTGAPGTYTYMGTSTIYEGTWTIARGTQSDPDALVYQLQLDTSRPPVSFLKADENHLFLMDGHGNLLAGNALFSYTLSRTDPDAQ